MTPPSQVCHGGTLNAILTYIVRITRAEPERIFTTGTFNLLSKTEPLSP